MLVDFVLFYREMLSLSDGGEVALDWVLNELSTMPSELRPTMIIMPGLVGQYCMYGQIHVYAVLAS